MEKTPLRWIRAQAEIGTVDPADVLMLCDRVEALERENEDLLKENDDLELIGTPIAGEYAVFLNEEDQQRLQTLYEKGELAYEQESDPGMELQEAIDYFVSGSLDMAWDMASFDPNKELRDAAFAKTKAQLLATTLPKPVKFKLPKVKQRKRRRKR